MFGPGKKKSSSDEQWQEACRSLAQCFKDLENPALSLPSRRNLLRRAYYWTKQKDQIALAGYNEHGKERRSAEW